MRAAAISMEDKINELLTILDKDIEQIEKNLSQLNELRDLVIRSDEVNLKKLLDNIRIESGSSAANELKRQSMRKWLAEAMGCAVGEATLSRLEGRLPEAAKNQVSEKKMKLRALVEKAHSVGAKVLLDCAQSIPHQRIDVQELGVDSLGQDSI